MTAARLLVTAETPGLGADRGPGGHRLRRLRHRLRRRGRHRARAVARRDARRPARASACSLFAFSRDALQKAAGQPRRPVHPHLPDHRLLQRPAAWSRTERIRVGGNLRFFGDGFQFSKKLDGPPLLAGAGHGRRVRLRGRLRHRQGRGRRQLPDPGRRSRRQRWPRPRRAVAAIREVPRRDPALPRRRSSAAAARSAAATRSCGPAPTTPTARRCAARDVRPSCPTA